MTARRRKNASAGGDPLLRPCPSCGVREGEGCKVTGTPDIRVPKASRLVHADRLALVEPVKERKRP